ncbi:MAG TPA: Co2+/Mg2+ efflux protein ApaG [Longimicrobiaceae bacterium]|nr:Co2+/Mg2+ efflux protein ApaG [Longimicrobiaceae bacterium]
MFHRTTEGMRITAQPYFLRDHSDPEEERYVFAYHVRIENTGDAPAQLLWRHWYIHDPVGGDTEVEGEGVVGEMPLIGPGEAHEYQSFCMLQGPSGHMDGYYEFRRPDGSRFRAAIPRFLFRVYEA